MIRATFIALPDPNSIIVSGARVCKLWSETYPGIGTIGTSAASVAALAAWSGTRATLTPGQADPDGGTGASLITEGTDSATAHYVGGAVSNAGSPWCNTRKWLRALPGGREWYLLYLPKAEKGIWINAATGAIGVNYPLGGSGVTATATAAGGGYWFDVVYRAGVAIMPAMRVYPANGDGTFTYNGDGRQCGLIYAPSITQIRAASHNNLALNTDGSLVDATGGVQATIANQPLILDKNGNFYTGLSGQVPVVTKESGRVAYLDYTDSDVAAIASGDNPAWWAMGIGKYASPPVTLLYFYGEGNILHTLWINVAGNVYLTRHDGTTYHDVQLGTAEAFASWATWALQVRADRTISLWVDGAERTGTQNALAAATMTGLRLGHNAATTGVSSMLACIIGTGDLGGYTAFQPALRAIYARYSPYPLKAYITAGIPAGVAASSAVMLLDTTISAGIPAGQASSNVGMLLEATVSAGIPAGQASSSVGMLLGAGITAGIPAGQAASNVGMLLEATVSAGVAAGYGSATVEIANEEFDISGATYYAVAPSGYTYSENQNTYYSTRKYTSLYAAVAALASATHPVINILGEWASADTAGNLAFPAITASGGIDVRAIGETKGSYIFERNSANSIIINGFAGTVRVSDITIRWSATTGATAGGSAIYNNVNSGRLDFIRCLGETSAQPSSAAAFFSTSGSSTGCTLNLIASVLRGYGSTANVVASYVGNTSGSTLRLYNTTIVSLYIGMYQTGSGTAIAKNVGNRATTAESGTISKTTCSTAAPTFEADGYHLASGDTTWRGQGTDLSEDASYPFDMDLDKDVITTWSIGCDSG